ncbi:MAG: HPr family phosphocarrier protein [Acidiferrobacterales bacterium]|jgi:phosphocarrier protein|nr:HPr family phosphocarrier protein [Gammaproteobacteria bacterium]
MRCQTITILNRLGLHARAAAKFVSLASEFESEITLTRDGKQVNGKSIMGIMMLAAGRHVVLELRIDGVDEERAMAKLSALVIERFGEDE